MGEEKTGVERRGIGGDWKQHISRDLYAILFRVISDRFMVDRVQTGCEAFGPFPMVLTGEH